MNTSISIHAKSEKVFEPTVKFIGSKPEANSFFLLRLDSFYVDVYLAHDQMITLRDALTSAIATSPLKCYAVDCEEVAVTTCENQDCAVRFCADHGQVEHDAGGGTNPNGSPFGEHTVPSICDLCIERSRA